MQRGDEKINKYWCKLLKISENSLVKKQPGKVRAKQPKASKKVKFISEYQKSIAWAVVVAKWTRKRREVDLSTKLSLNFDEKIYHLCVPKVIKINSLGSIRYRYGCVTRRPDETLNVYYLTLLFNPL